MKLIDADALIETLNDNGVPYNADANYFVETAPTIEAVSVVRCKDCVKRMREDCPMCNGCKLDRVPTEDDDFCSYGEREGE